MAVVEKALADGHDVTAFVRNTEGYSPGSDVRVNEGDARDRSAMDPAMLGQDAVIDTVGGKLSFKTTTLESSAAATIIASMQASGVRPLVVISVIGAGESVANTNWYERLFLSTVLRSEIKDKSSYGGDCGCKWSRLDYRLPTLSQRRSSSGDVHVFSAESGETAHELTRDNLAAFMVAQLSSDEHLQKTVAIANS